MAKSKLKPKPRPIDSPLPYETVPLNRETLQLFIAPFLHRKRGFAIPDEPAIKDPAKRVKPKELHQPRFSPYRQMPMPFYMPPFTGDQPMEKHPKSIRRDEKVSKEAAKFMMGQYFLVKLRYAISRFNKRKRRESIEEIMPEIKSILEEGRRAMGDKKWEVELQKFFLEERKI